MTSVNFNRIDGNVWELVFGFNRPIDIHQFAQVSRSCACVSQGSVWRLRHYFDYLTKSLGKERLNELLGRITWTPSKVTFDELTRNVYQYVCVTSLGRKLVAKPAPLPSGMICASQLVRIVKLRDQEEDENLIKIANRLLPRDRYSRIMEYIKKNRPGKKEEEIHALTARTIRKAIAVMTVEERNGIQKLDLSILKLTSIPKEIFSLTSLTSLDVNDNDITSLTPGISKLNKLESLDISGNKITTLSLEIGAFTKLQFFYSTGNNLSNLPPAIGALSSLIFFQADQNKIKALPPEVGQLRQLESLDISGNKITALPAEMDKLGKLRILDLRGNQIEIIPPRVNTFIKAKRKMGQLAVLHD